MDHKSSSFQWEIDPSVVYQLGESLISDEVQALVELAKNSYDADATYAKIKISTRQHPHKDCFYHEDIGYIEIEDDGDGMTPDDIQRGWLTISKSPKIAMKAEGRTTDRGRTPLGEKGLGRLGVQRLGYNVEIFTRPKGQDVEYHVGFNWKDFGSAPNIASVEVKSKKYSPAKRKKSGTTLIISDLINTVVWTDKDSVRNLITELSKLLSPFKDVQAFRVTAEINSSRLELARITERVRETSQLRYWLRFDHSRFEVTGKARLAFFRPPAHDIEQLQQFKLLVEEDQGSKFFDFLLTRKIAEQYHLKRPDDENWFVEFTSVRDFDSFADLTLVGSQFANPGPFSGEIDSFDLGEGQSVFDKKSVYKEYIKDLAGIRVYRDGFGIRVDEDWLGLGKQQTSAPSYYGLRPSNTIGYIALSARDNAVLGEKTDREGFKKSPYYNNFYAILYQGFIRYSASVQEALRRAWHDFRRMLPLTQANLEETTTPENITTTITNKIAASLDYRKDIETISSRLVNSHERNQKIVAKAESSLPKDSPQLRAIRIEADGLADELEETRATLQKTEKYLTDLTKILPANEVLKSQIGDLREQLQSMYEAVSVGLTAEAFAHEIENATQQLSTRTRQITQYLSDRKEKDVRIFTYIEYINTSISALRKQLSYFSPSLRYLREKRENIAIQVFVEETVEHYQSRFEKHEISYVIDATRAVDFVVFMNKGKLRQVVDNLFLNSEYWLREALRRDTIINGIISVEIRKPFIRISDNGRGVEPSVEASLFEPFVTTKGKGKGRGLGLFIVRQLLDSENCQIALLPERNNEGRRYIFEIDLTGSLSKNA